MPIRLEVTVSISFFCRPYLISATNEKKNISGGRTILEAGLDPVTKFGKLLYKSSRMLHFRNT